MKRTFLIRASTTQTELAIMVARCFEGVRRPLGAGDIISVGSSAQIMFLAWGEKHNAVGLLERQRYGIALVRLHPISFQLLRQAYEYLGRDLNVATVGVEMKLDMTPLKVWLPIAT